MQSYSYQPDVPMVGDGPDHQLILDEADDPHGPLAFRADHGVDLIYFYSNATILKGSSSLAVMLFIPQCF